MAVGLLTVAELNPVAGLHEYVAVASLASPIVAPEEFVVHVLVNGLPALTDGIALTVIVGVVVSSPLQFVGAPPVTRTLNVVVDVRVPVGKLIVPPVPDTAEPIFASFASFLSW